MFYVGITCPALAAADLTLRAHLSKEMENVLTPAGAAAKITLNPEPTRLELLPRLRSKPNRPIAKRHKRECEPGGRGTKQE